MIKAEDLRIGDLVQHESHILKVVGLHNSGSVSFYVSNEHLVVGENDVNPIPLTNEILEKNGWLQKEYACEVFYYIELNMFADIFFLYDDKNECFSVGLFFRTTFGYIDILYFPLDIKYIHELQHILYLFKDALIIKKMKPLQI